MIRAVRGTGSRTRRGPKEKRDRHPEVPSPRWPGTVGAEATAAAAQMRRCRPFCSTTPASPGVPSQYPRAGSPPLAIMSSLPLRSDTVSRRSIARGATASVLGGGRRTSTKTGEERGGGTACEPTQPSAPLRPAAFPVTPSSSCRPADRCWTYRCRQPSCRAVSPESRMGGGWLPRRGPPYRVLPVALRVFLSV